MHRLAKHLVSPANSKDRAAAAQMRGQVHVPALIPQKARSPRVDLLPGRITRSLSPGIASPARTMRRATPGSCERGSRSSKLAIRLKARQATFSPLSRAFRGQVERILGRQLRGLGKERQHAQPRQPVRAAISR